MLINFLLINHLINWLITAALLYRAGSKTHQRYQRFVYYKLLSRSRQIFVLDLVSQAAFPKTRCCRLLFVQGSGRFKCQTDRHVIVWFHLSYMIKNQSVTVNSVILWLFSRWTWPSPRPPCQPSTQWSTSPTPFTTSGTLVWFTAASTTSSPLRPFSPAFTPWRP